MPSAHKIILVRGESPEPRASTINSNGSNISPRGCAGSVSWRGARRVRSARATNAIVCRYVDGVRNWRPIPDVPCACDPHRRTGRGQTRWLAHSRRWLVVHHWHRVVLWQPLRARAQRRDRAWCSDADRWIGVSRGVGLPCRCRPQSLSSEPTISAVDSATAPTKLTESSEYLQENHSRRRTIIPAL